MTRTLSKAQRTRILRMLSKQLGRMDELEGAIMGPLMRGLEEAKNEALTAIQVSLRGTTKLTPFGIQRLRKLVADMDVSFKALDYIVGDKAALLLREAEPRVAALAIQGMSESRVTLSDVFGHNAVPVNISVAEILSNTQPLYKQFATSSKRYAGAIGDQMMATLRLSMVRGETFHEAAERLQQRLPTTFSRYTAERLVRTELMDAHNHYAVEGLWHINQQDPGWVMRVDGSLDSRICPMCRSMHGQVCDVLGGEQFKSRQLKGKAAFAADRPPFHPRCRCVVMAWRKDWGTVV